MDTNKLKYDEVICFENKSDLSIEFKYKEFTAKIPLQHHKEIRSLPVSVLLGSFRNAIDDFEGSNGELPLNEILAMTGIGFELVRNYELSNGQPRGMSLQNQAMSQSGFAPVTGSNAQKQREGLLR